MKTTFVASASEIQSSDLFMTVKTTMFTSPSPNLNGVRCSEAFLDEIVENQDKYITLPLCADIKNLTQGRYDRLGHCYNERTNEFSSTDIGSFYRFEKQDIANGEKALVGYARIQKRKKAVCKALTDLFLDNALKVSFEISCGSCKELEDHTILIDKAADNYLEGMCVVSFPACPDAVAQQLVAEIVQQKEEVSEMNKTDVKTEEQNETVIVAEEVQAEEAKTEDQATETVQTAEVTETAEADQEKPAEETVVSEETQPENAQAQEPEKVSAELVVTESVHEVHEVETYDTESCESSRERVEYHDSVTHVEPGNLGYALVAETDETSDNVLAELQELRKELASMRELVAQLQKDRSDEPGQTEHLAEVDQTNPFMTDMTAGSTYTLLASAEPVEQSYSLLERA